MPRAPGLRWSGGPGGRRELPIPFLADIRSPEGALRWIGGWSGLFIVLGLQVVLALAFVLDWKYALAAVVALALFFTILERPVLGVGLLVMARLMDTARNAFIRIGHTSIGFFEAAMLLGLIALVLHVVRHRRLEVTSWPWLPPLLAFMGWQAISLTWSVSKGDGISEMITMAVVVVSATLILNFVRSPEQFQFVTLAWVTASVLIGLLTLAGDALGISDSGPWQAAEGGGRETGLGQQPNWFAMNLMFIVHTTFGLAVVQKRRWAYWLLIVAGLFVFVTQMRSGSRGGTYAIIIGGTITAMAVPLFRKWFLRFALFVVFLFAITITMDFGPTSQALNRIWDNLGHTWSNVRGMNWSACVSMFVDTWGRGIGPGGYVDLLPQYSWFLYNSVYRYPHGIFWGLLAHYGVVGLAIFTWLAITIFRMGRRLTAWTRDTSLYVVAWTMPATMFGYAAWSFVEFEYNEKPFWEFLALYTALYLVVERYRAEGRPLPVMTRPLRLPWSRTAASPPPTEAPAAGG